MQPVDEGCAFGRESRLHNRSQFSFVRENGVSKAGRLCIVNVLKPSLDGGSRAGFSISKRYSKLAVERNRARRIFREVYRCVYGRCKGCWVIFVPRHSMLNAKMQDVLAEVETALAEILEK